MSNDQNDDPFDDITPKTPPRKVQLNWTDGLHAAMSLSEIFATCDIADLKAIVHAKSADDEEAALQNLKIIPKKGEKDPEIPYMDIMLEVLNNACCPFHGTIHIFAAMAYRLRVGKPQIGH